MIKRLKLDHIGPAPALDVEEFGARLNLVTGDNGLGKTFLLDACWYALIRTWADGKQFYPWPDAPKKPAPAIEYGIIGKNGAESKNRAEYQFRDQSWFRKRARPPIPGLVLYARIDGGFSVWDPARNYWRDEETAEGRERPNAYQFTKDQVWEGLEPGEEKQKKIICNGLLRDVENWRAKQNGAFDLLGGVLKGLSAREPETLKLGEGVRVRVNDARDIPTLLMPYGTVPVTQAAAGMRRVLALAYLLVWAWEEHVRAAKLQKEAPSDRIVLLFDEVEAHLHPKWQRVFLPSLMNVVDGLLLKGQAEAIRDDPAKRLDRKAKSLLGRIPRAVQIIATTHSPLVLASAETVWSATTDKLFDFDLDENRRVRLGEVGFAKHGSAVNWLTSSFDLATAYPVAAEQAMERADLFMREHPEAADAPPAEKEAIHRALKAALGGDDEYWPYWLPYYEPAKASA
jgi:hypothetical protein